MLVFRTMSKKCEKLSIFFAKVARYTEFPDEFKREAKKQYEFFKQKRKYGCCGFCDSEVIGPDGKKYLIGFNYGH